MQPQTKSSPKDSMAILTANISSWLPLHLEQTGKLTFRLYSAFWFKMGALHTKQVFISAASLLGTNMLFFF